jgi:predicted deacetylase
MDWRILDSERRSRPMIRATERLLLGSIHDVSPRFETEVDRLLDLLAPHLGLRIAMLVVPNHWGDAPIVPGSPFATRLRGWADAGIEIFLHGYFHRGNGSSGLGADRLRASLMTAGEGEFLGLSREDASCRIAEGRSLLEGVIGRAIHGFVAPAWLYSRGTRAALEEAGIPLCEDHLHIWSPATGARLASGPVITWASRTRLRLASSLAAATILRHVPMKVLRIGVHPPDCRYPSLLESIDKTLRNVAKERIAGSYSDLLPELAAAA